MSIMLINLERTFLRSFCRVRQRDGKSGQNRGGRNRGVHQQHKVFIGSPYFYLRVFYLFTDDRPSVAVARKVTETNRQVLNKSEIKLKVSRRKCSARRRKKSSKKLICSKYFFSFKLGKQLLCYFSYFISYL